MLTDRQRQSLLAVARQSIVARVSGLAVALVHDDPLPPACGVFVTLKHDGELRGCLGTLACELGLLGEVARCAADAASEDPRFAPVMPAQVHHLSLEVSILGPLERINPRTPDAFTIGTHGLVIEHGPKRGLLLPQVAGERRWTREQFLAQVCVKADLPPQAWTLGAILYRFDAEVFGD